MGIDNDVKMYFGWTVNRGAMLEYLVSQLSDGEEEDCFYEMIETVREKVEFSLVGIPGEFIFTFDRASPYFDADEESCNFFFGIATNDVNSKEMEIFIHWREQPGADAIIKVARTLGIEDDDEPCISALPHIY